jgi:hypothetical protein
MYWIIYLHVSDEVAQDLVMLNQWKKKQWQWLAQNNTWPIFRKRRKLEVKKQTIKFKKKLIRQVSWQTLLNVNEQRFCLFFEEPSECDFSRLFKKKPWLCSNFLPIFFYFENKMLKNDFGVPGLREEDFLSSSKVENKSFYLSFSFLLKIIPTGRRKNNPTFFSSRN